MPSSNTVPSAFLKKHKNRLPQNLRQAVCIRGIQRSIDFTVLIVVYVDARVSLIAAGIATPGVDIECMRFCSGMITAKIVCSVLCRCDIRIAHIGVRYVNKAPIAAVKLHTMLAFVKIG